MQDAKEIEDHGKKIEPEKNNIEQMEHEEKKTNSTTLKNIEVVNADSDEVSFKAANDDDSEECALDDIIPDDFNGSY